MLTFRLFKRTIGIFITRQSKHQLIREIKNIQSNISAADNPLEEIQKKLYQAQQIFTYQNSLIAQIKEGTSIQLIRISAHLRYAWVKVRKVSRSTCLFEILHPTGEAPWHHRRKLGEAIIEFSGDTGYVARLRVDEAHFGFGIGNQLIIAVVQECKMRGKPYVRGIIGNDFTTQSGFIQEFLINWKYEKLVSPDNDFTFKLIVNT